MINFNQIDIETGLKLVSGFTAIFALILRIFQNFSPDKRKKSIKTDLEILELIKKHDQIESNLLVENLNEKIYDIYINSSQKLDNFRSFLYGMAMFLGFSWWSIDIFINQSKFNPLIIFTGLMASTGFILLFDRDKEYHKIRSKIDIEPFLVFEIFRKFDFILGLVLFIICGIASWILTIKSEGFSYWIILTGILTLAGLRMMLAEIKINSKKKKLKTSKTDDTLNSQL